MERTISFDPTDLNGMCRMMDEYGDSASMFSGTNESGEDIWISICPDTITVRTFQDNGWARIDTYDRDGTCEQIFDGRWKAPGTSNA